MGLSPLITLPSNIVQAKNASGSKDRNREGGGTKPDKGTKPLTNKTNPFWKMHAKPGANRPMAPKKSSVAKPLPKVGKNLRRASGDAIRQSPEKGVELGEGTLFWKLEYVDKKTKAKVKQKEGININTTSTPDVKIKARFVGRKRTACPSYTFVQTIKSTTGANTPDYGHPHLLFTRDSISGASVDAKEDEIEPFYTAERSKDSRKWQGEIAPDSNKRDKLAGRRRGKVATFDDTPLLPMQNIIKGQTSRREFELAVLCIETGKTLGSLRWGYTKTPSGLVKLLGGQVKDVRQKSASAGFERARTQFYKGNFQYSIHSFYRGSSRLTRAHRKELDRVAKYRMVREILLVGANDYSGGPENSARLALRRAQAVRKYLIEAKVPASKIKVIGHGVHARYPNRRGQRVGRNRRVDIRISWGNNASTNRATLGSIKAGLLIQSRDPRSIIANMVAIINRLSNTKKAVPYEDCSTLRFQSLAILRWRKVDPSIPNIEKIYDSQLRSIYKRCK